MVEQPHRTTQSRNNEVYIVFMECGFVVPPICSSFQMPGIETRAAAEPVTRTATAELPAPMAVGSNESLCENSILDQRIHPPDVSKFAISQI
jgi:hypothetical protein